MDIKVSLTHGHVETITGRSLETDAAFLDLAESGRHSPLFQSGACMSEAPLPAFPGQKIILSVKRIKVNGTFITFCFHVGLLLRFLLFKHIPVRNTVHTLVWLCNIADKC